jgi:exonuclease III
MGSMLYDRESCEDTRLQGQNVRGLTPLKLEVTVQFMKDREILVSCLMETWRVTKDGVEFEELDGYLIIHHGESKQSGKNRARNGVAIILAPKAREAWEQGGSKVRHSANGRVLTVVLPLRANRTHTVGVAYSPVSSKSSAERQSFYDDIATQTRS